jgi:hypothetical protein
LSINGGDYRKGVDKEWVLAVYLRQQRERRKNYRVRQTTFAGIRGAMYERLGRQRADRTRGNQIEDTSTRERNEAGRAVYE